MSEIVSYIPVEGDVVTFPGAPLKSNRTRRYVVTRVVDDKVSFKIEDERQGYVYIRTLQQLFEIGMQKAQK